MTVTLNEQLPPAAIVVLFNNAIVLVAAVVVRLFVPPQTENVPFATDKPAGKTSVKATPVRVVDVFGLSMLKLSVVVLLVKIGFAVNDFAITGGSITVSEDVPIPLEVVFGPESVEETLLLTFVYDPAVAPVTVTLIVQVPLAAIVPPESEMVRGEVLVNVPVVQTVVEPDVTVSPEGSTSENETPAKAEVLGFVSVNVSVLVLPVPIEVGEKLLERFGTVGLGQPVKVILSRKTEEVDLEAFLLSAVMRK